MKRRIAIIIVFLLLGAAVNVAVATWCAVKSPIALTISEDRFYAIEDRTWWWNSPLRLHLDELPQLPQLWRGHGRGVAIKAARAELEYDYAIYMAGPVKALHYVCISAGWPFLSMQGEVDFYGRRGSPDVLLLRNGGIVEYTASVQSPWDVEDDLGWWLQAARPLPLRPLMRGFIINTLFYALLLWLMIVAPLAARRTLRRRRGLCEKCAYPIGVSPVCTECGVAGSKEGYHIGRGTATIIVFLLLGAAVNVAVAWGCALLSMESWRATAISHEHQFLITYPSWEEPRNEGYTYSVTSRYWKADSLVVGWPTHSVEAKLPDSRPLQWPEARPLMGHIIYASRPVWPTFEINTIFYAAILWAVIAALAKLKGTLRRRRGLCEKCAYPIGVSPVCTECGAAVVRKVTT